MANGAESVNNELDYNDASEKTDASGEDSEQRDPPSNTQQTSEDPPISSQDLSDEQPETRLGEDHNVEAHIPESSTATSQHTLGESINDESNSLRQSSSSLEEKQAEEICPHEDGRENEVPSYPSTATADQTAQSKPLPSTSAAIRSDESTDPKAEFDFPDKTEHGRSQGPKDERRPEERPGAQSVEDSSSIHGDSSVSNDVHDRDRDAIQSSSEQESEPQTPGQDGKLPSSSRVQSSSEVTDIRTSGTTDLEEELHPVDTHAAASTGQQDAAMATTALERSAPQVIIMGAPGSGKGTQCSLIQAEFGVIHVSPGDMLRGEIERKSSIGMQCRDAVAQGTLVPDDIITPMVLERLQSEECRRDGWLLDGFPRTIAQAEALHTAGFEPDIVLVLDVAEEDLVDRVAHRRIDPVTNTVYHLKNNPPLTEEIAARLIRRADDMDEATCQRRLQEFTAHHAPVVEYYDSKIVGVDGARQVEQVFTDILEAIDRSLQPDGESFPSPGKEALSPAWRTPSVQSPTNSMQTSSMKYGESSADHFSPQSGANTPAARSMHPSPANSDPGATEELGREHLELLSRLQNLEFQFGEMHASSRRYERVLQAYFEAKKGEERARGMTEKTVTDREQRYVQCLEQVEQQYEQREALERQLREQLEAREASLEATELRLQADESEYTRARQIGTEAAAQLGKSALGKRLLALEKAEREGRLELEQARLKNIVLSRTLKNTQTALQKKEELSNELHLIDFEQLKIENQTLNEKIEERNEELLKLRKKTMTTVQVLTHLKEKLTFVRHENHALHERLRNVDVELGSQRDILTRLKLTRDEARAARQEERQKSGLVGRPELVGDFATRRERAISRTMQEILSRRPASYPDRCRAAAASAKRHRITLRRASELREKVEELKREHARLASQARSAKRVESAAPSSAASSAFPQVYGHR